MRTFFTSVLSILTLSSVCGQALNDFTQPTEAHVQVTGTNYHLIPPEGFSPSSQFKGFQNEEDPFTSVLVMEMPAPFSAISEGFTAGNAQTEAGLKRQNMKLLSSNPIEVVGGKALWVEVEQEAYGYTFTKSILIVGDESQTVMINATALKENTEAYADVVDCIRSLVITNENIDPRAALPYTLDETVGNLQFIQVAGNAMMFSRDGKVPSETQDHPLFLTIDRAMNQTQVPNHKRFLLQRMGQIPGGYEQPEEADLVAVEQDGLSGYQAPMQSTEKEETMVLRILYPEEGGYYIMFFIFSNGDTASEQEGYAVLNTFQRK